MKKWRFYIQWIDNLKGEKLSEKNSDIFEDIIAPDANTAWLIGAGIAFQRDWTSYGSMSRVEEVR